MTYSVATPRVLGRPCGCVWPGLVGEVPGPSLLVCLLPASQPSTRGAVLAVPGRGGTQKTFPVSSEYMKPPWAAEATLSPEMMTILEFLEFFHCPSKALKFT